ncbi:hypothetical protein EYC59_03795 [Candidatus Saccharibacteria bacterium]|nr:MAG: hypothetical protein EYC59_03795 [Candidatus Saccharibacteria bacterium]
MRETLHEQLGRELTRKQFLHLMTAALLAIFGLNNLISLLTGQKLFSNQERGRHGFGSSKFGV